LARSRVAWTCSSSPTWTVPARASWGACNWRWPTADAFPGSRSMASSCWRSIPTPRPRPS